MVKNNTNITRVLFNITICSMIATILLIGGYYSVIGLLEINITQYFWGFMILDGLFIIAGVIETILEVIQKRYLHRHYHPYESLCRGPNTLLISLIMTFLIFAIYGGLWIMRTSMIDNASIMLIIYIIIFGFCGCAVIVSMCIAVIHEWKYQCDLVLCRNEYYVAKHYYRCEPLRLYSVSNFHVIEYNYGYGFKLYKGKKLWGEIRRIRKTSVFNFYTYLLMNNLM